MLKDFPLSQFEYISHAANVEKLGLCSWLAKYLLVIVNPLLFRYLPRHAIYFTIGVIFASFFEIRVAYSFFPLLLVFARLPSFRDRRFWVASVTYFLFSIAMALHWLKTILPFTGP